MSEKKTTIALSHEQFESFVEKNKIVLVDFWAPWCAPCRQFGITYEKVAGLFNGVSFAKVNVEEEVELGELFQIRSIPHMMVFKDGIAIYSEAGSMPESTLKELVQQAIDADVSDIHEQLQNENK